MSGQARRSGSGGESGGSDDGAGTGSRAGAGVDWAWEFCTQVEQTTKQKTRCKFCDKQINSGGISRFKAHIVGGDKNVVKCKKVPEEIRKFFKTKMGEKSQLKARDLQTRKKMKEAMFGFGDRDRDRNIIDLGDDDSDDDIAYPSDVDTPQRRKDFRDAIKESARMEKERREGIGRYFGGQGTSGAGGSGGGRGLGSPAMEGVRTHSTRFTASEPAFRKTSAKQKTLKGMWKNAKDLVGQACSKFIFAHGIAPNVASGPYLQNVIDVCAEYGRGTEAPTPHEIMNKYLPAEKQEIEDWIEGQKQKAWSQFGVTLMCDGWTSGTRQQIINFLVYCDGMTYYLRSVDASSHVKSHTYLIKLIDSVIAEVGKENVVQIVTDNGSNFKKAGQTLEESGKYKLYWTPCAAHCVDLILKDFGKEKLFKYVMPKARRITNFIYNRGFLLAMMRSKDYCGGDIVRPGLTRFASNFIALQSLKEKKQGLLRLFTSEKWHRHTDSTSVAAGNVMKIIYDDTFWKKLTKAINIMCPVVHVLRMVDGDKKPTMPYIYESVRLMREFVAQAAGKNSHKGYLDIIDARWEGMLSHPLHKAAYYLNPRFQYSQNLGMKADLQAALHQVIDKLSPDNDKALFAMGQVKHFREAAGVFGIRHAIYARDKMAPAEWWAEFGTDCEELRAIAVRILSQTAAAGGCERNWSTFNLIHTKRRNRLGAKRLHMLVYVHYNLKLKEKFLHDRFSKPTTAFGLNEDPLDWAYIYHDNDDDDDPLQAWLNDEGPLLDVGSSGATPDPTIADQMGIDMEAYRAEEGNTANAAHGRIEPTRDDPGDFFANLPADEGEASSGSTPEPSGGYKSDKDSSSDGNDSSPSTPGSHIRGFTPTPATPPPVTQPTVPDDDTTRKRTGKEAELPPRHPMTYQKKGKGKKDASGPQAQQEYGYGYGTYGSGSFDYGYGYGSYGQPPAQGPPPPPHGYDVDRLAESIGSWHISPQSETQMQTDSGTFMDSLFGYSVAPDYGQDYRYGAAPASATQFGSSGHDRSSSYGGISIESTARRPTPSYDSLPPVLSSDSGSFGPSYSYTHSQHDSAPGSDATRARIATYTRFGYLQEISDSEFAAYVADYDLRYSTSMTWMQYAFRLDNMLANRRRNEDEENARHSAWY